MSSWREQATWSACRPGVRVLPPRIPRLCWPLRPARRRRLPRRGRPLDWGRGTCPPRSGSGCEAGCGDVPGRRAVRRQDIPERSWRLKAALGLWCFFMTLILWTWGPVWHARKMDSRWAGCQDSKEGQRQSKRAQFRTVSMVSALKKAQGRATGRQEMSHLGERQISRWQGAVSSGPVSRSRAMPAGGRRSKPSAPWGRGAIRESAALRAAVPTRGRRSKPSAP